MKAGQLTHLSHLPCSGKGEGKMPSPYPLPPVAGERAGLRVTRVEELSPPSLTVADKKSNLCFLSGAVQLELTMLLETQVSQP